MVRRSQLAQGCAAVRFVLGHGKSIERTLFITIPITRRDHRSERKLRGREDGREAETRLVSALREKTRKSTFRSFANSSQVEGTKQSRNAPSFRSRERILRFKRRRRNRIWQKLIQFIAIVRIIYNCYIR